MYGWGLASTVGDEVPQGKQRDIDAMIARGQWPKEPLLPSTLAVSEAQKTQIQGE